MLIGAIVIGVINACLAIALDFAMQYGHLLGSVRLDRARKAAKKAGNIDVTEGDAKKEVSVLESFNADVERGENIIFGERIQYFEDLYWWVATYNNDLVWWLCVKCLSYRIFVISFIASVVAFGLGLGDAVQLLFIGSSANLITIMILTTTTQGKG